MREQLTALTKQALQNDSQIVLLIMILIFGIIVIDSLFQTARKKRGKAGLDIKAEVISVDGSQTLPVRNYVSKIQGLAGRPDALIREHGFVIPVERKPLAKKLRDRYIAQLLVYMRLVEEFEGKKPPYGYLILGPDCKRVRIDNTPVRQRWLQKQLDEMRKILEGAPARPAPHPKKCGQCGVRSSCSTYQAKMPNEKNDAPIKINKSTAAAQG
jgi:CRISPR/Cas system-associated exonuclease Cas4 (RecB family)